MALQPVKVGVVGCGNISSAYLTIAKKFPILDVVALADLDMARAKARAQEFGVPKACSVRSLMQRDDVEIVLNLTTPQAHAKVALAAIKAGKHVYGEKPLAVTRREGQRILQAAEAAGLRVGCAPDTVLGGGHQTARKLIDDGVIGKPVSAVAFMMSRGHEGWHPDPEFYYQAGGGPMMDMGPYYLSDLTMLMGPIRRVAGSAGILIADRVIASGPKQGQAIAVEVPDHITGVMDFQSGAVGTIITTFAVNKSSLPRIEIYGAEGALSVPDPNVFGGKVLLCKRGEREWQEAPLTHDYLTNHRALGLADMATALRTGRKHRVTGTQAYHVLDVMLGFTDSAAKGRYYNVPSTFERPAALPTGLPEGVLDE